MGNIKEILSRYGFATLLFIFMIILLIIAGGSGQNSWVMMGIITVLGASVLIALHNSGVIPVKLTSLLVAILVVCSLTYAYFDYSSIQNKLDFMKIQAAREGKVVESLKDIRKAQVSYKKLYGEYADSFDKLESHVKNDSMPVVKAIGSVPDTLTELKAVQLGIVTRDTIKISVRDTLFPSSFNVDSMRYVPYSGGQEFELQASEIEKNKLQVKVFEAFASNEKILNGLDLSEVYVDLDEGLRVGSMTDPHTRGNWE